MGTGTLKIDNNHAATENHWKHQKLTEIKNIDTKLHKNVKAFQAGMSARVEERNKLLRVSKLPLRQMDTRIDEAKEAECRRTTDLIQRQKDIIPYVNGEEYNRGCVFVFVPLLASLAPFLVLGLAPEFLFLGMIISFGAALALLFIFHGKGAYSGKLPCFLVVITSAGLSGIAYNDITEYADHGGEAWLFASQAIVLIGAVILVWLIRGVLRNNEGAVGRQWMRKELHSTNIAAVVATAGIICAIVPNML